MKKLSLKGTTEKWIVEENPVFPDVLQITPPFFKDNRGYLIIRLDSVLKEIIPNPVMIDTIIQSKSVQGTIRGIHCQIRNVQSKLIWVIRGSIFNAVVDIRPESPTFGKWQASNLSRNNHHMLWVPEGFANGFYVTSRFAEVIYCSTNRYSPEWERIIKWDDPTLNIAWPILPNTPITLSDKDSTGKPFLELIREIKGQR